MESIASHNLSPSNDLSSVSRQVQWFTIMREPIKRYISHFQFYVNRWGYNKTAFDDWLDLDYHKNNQVKMIAGKDDIDSAIELIRGFSVVGLQENYTDSMNMLASFTGNLYVPDLIRKKKNTARNRHVEGWVKQHWSRFEQKLIEANDLDLELYRFVKKELFPAQMKDLLSRYDTRSWDSQNIRFRMNFNRLVNYIVRNGIRRPLRIKAFRFFGFGNPDL